MPAAAPKTISPCCSLALVLLVRIQVLRNWLWSAWPGMGMEGGVWGETWCLGLVSLEYHSIGRNRIWEWYK